MGLQEHPSFMPGTKIANIYNQGGRWVAKLMEPKLAETEVEPCKHCEDKGCQHCKKTAADSFEDINESPADLHEEKHEKHEESESPFEELEEHEDEENSDTKKLNELEKKLDLLLDALGISEKGDEPEIPGGLDNEGPADLPAAPESKGPAKSDPLPPGSGAKLKPGEVPNKPGMTPVGAPAFASVKTASCDGECEEGSCKHCDSKRHANASVPPNSAMAQNPAGTNCPTCGAPAGTCQCASASTGTSAPVTAFTASKLDSGRTLTIRQAKAQLENHYKGFRVARIKRDGDAIHARLETR
jgi:hypothetical protein